MEPDNMVEKTSILKLARYPLKIVGNILSLLV